ALSDGRQLVVGAVEQLLRGTEHLCLPAVGEDGGGDVDGRPVRAPIPGTSGDGGPEEGLELSAPDLQKALEERRELSGQMKHALRAVRLRRVTLQGAQDALRRGIEARHRLRALIGREKAPQVSLDGGLLVTLEVLDGTLLDLREGDPDRGAGVGPLDADRVRLAPHEG